MKDLKLIKRKLNSNLRETGEFHPHTPKKSAKVNMMTPDIKKARRNKVWDPYSSSFITRSLSKEEARSGCKTSVKVTHPAFQPHMKDQYSIGNTEKILKKVSCERVSPSFAKLNFTKACTKMDNMYPRPFLVVEEAQKREKKEAAKPKIQHPKGSYVSEKVMNALNHYKANNRRQVDTL